MPRYPSPTVPNAPGVPLLPRLASASAVVGLGLGLAQALLWRVFSTQGHWGIFDKNHEALGDPAVFSGLDGIALDSIGIGSMLSTNSVSYSKEMKVSDFPVEAGGFAAYNKVEQPATPVVIMALDANAAGRKSYLEAIDNAVKSTDLYSVVTPEVTYTLYAIESYRYERRAARGATLLMVELRLLEVRQVSAVFSRVIIDPKNPGATPSVNSGIVQPKSAGTSVLKGLANKLGGF